MMSGINVVKASNFCFISDNKFLKVPEKPQDHVDRGGTGREHTCSYDSSEEQLQVGLQVVTFTNDFAAARKAVQTATPVAYSEQQCMSAWGYRAGKQ